MRESAKENEGGLFATSWANASHATTEKPHPCNTLTPSTFAAATPNIAKKYCSTSGSQKNEPEQYGTNIWSLRTKHVCTLVQTERDSERLSYGCRIAWILYCTHLILRGGLSRFQHFVPLHTAHTVRLRMSMCKNVCHFIAQSPRMRLLDTRAFALRFNTVALVLQHTEITPMHMYKGCVRRDERAPT